MKSFLDKTVLVTGGCGFIGSSLVSQLILKGARVIVVDNLSTGKKKNLPKNSDKVSFHKIDIREIDEIRGLLKECQIIFHLACLGVRQSIHSPRENNEVNATATLDLLILSHEEKVERFIHISTSEVYGNAFKVPMDESTPTFPHTIYGSSKLAGECHVRAFSRTYGLPAVILRPFNSYGPGCHHEGDSGEVIPKFILRTLANRPMLIFGNGLQTRDFTFVEDTALGIVMAGICDSALGQTINLGSGSEITINDLASLVGSLTGKPNAEVNHLEPRPGDILRLFSDSKSAEKLLGFKPKTNIRDGLLALIDWYKSSSLTPEQHLESDLDLNWILETKR
tara:strand:+ start:14381 stop:15394 length:1014 start_codon:yes stop_codon:yes gene_type:complete